LLVDDHVDTLTTLRDVLLLEGVAEVQVAASIPEAERILADGFKPSVVVVDLQLDGERGETLIAKLRARPTSRAVPIVALSGNHISLRQLGTTVDRGILKPADPDELIAAVRAVCGAP
jgi:two-component system OmpR family response regulator